MIKYSLICENDHEFESWFAGADSFDTQIKRGFVECPVCQSNKVDRAIMAPSVARTDKEIVASLPVAQEPNWVSAGSEEILMSPEMVELRERMAELRDEMIKNADDVGSDFAEEARRIHYGETEKRQIYGHTSLDEVQELLEEGIGVLPLPPGRDIGH
jgi:hypothetical protein